ncbi:MAG: SprB repeat-containing protein, partial [Bacteroidota bacterium]
MRTFCSLLFLWVNFLTLCAQPLIKKTTPTNEGACTARAFVEFTAGTTGPYFLSLDGPTTLSDQKFHKRTILRNLCAGTHTLTLTDDFNCTTSTEFTIHECQELSLTNPDLFLTQPTSCEAADGIYRLSLDGLFASQQILNGTAPFAFTLINLSNGDQRRLQSGAGGLNWENLSAGNYLLQMEDSKDCKGSHRFSLTSPEGNRPVVHGVDEIPACTNGRPGYLYVVAAGPNQEACEFSWNDPQLPVETSTSSLIEAQPGQEYAVTITCCNNPDCAVVLDNLKVTAEVPDDPLGILDEVSVCNTCLNGPYSGTVEIQVSGGIAPYRFQWSNGAIGRKLTNALVDATYCVTVTDGCDNTATRCPYIPPSPYALLEVEADVSPTNQLGSIELWPSGGDGDYRFHWSNGSSEQNLYNLVSGIYQVTVSDGQGCEVIESYEINNCRGGTHDGNDPLRVDAIAHGNPSGQGCQGNKTLRVRTAQGGQPPYLLHIELVSSPVDPDFADIRRYEVQPMGYPQNLNTLDFEVPAGRYFIRLFDACGNEVNQSVDLCEHCGYTYDPGRRRFSLGDRGQVEIILHCDCAFRCDGQDNYLELKFISRGMTEMDYALTWPDGSQAFFEYNQGGHISGQVRYHFEQPPPSGRIDEVVQVERADGCVFEIPVIVNDGGQESILFSDLHSNYGGQYYTGTSVCNLCVPDPGYYEPQEATCFDGIDPETLPMVFGYLPNNINNPCAGGGKLQAHRIVKSIDNDFSIDNWVGLELSSACARVVDVVG